MNMLEILMQAQGGQNASALAQRFGLDQSQTQKAMGALLPAILGGFKQKAQQGGGIEDLLGSVLGGGQRHQSYIDDPAAIESDAAIGDGNDLLGQIFGSKDVSRQVAGQAAQSTGIDANVLKKMLPVIAAMAAGAMAKAGGGQAAAPSRGGLGGVLGSMLGGGSAPQQKSGLGGLAQMLDLDGDGNPLDDIMGMAGKFLKR